MTVKVIGLKAAIDSLSTKERRGSQALRTELSKQGDALAIKAQQYAPRDTGAVENSIHVEEQERGVIARIEVVADGPGSRGRDVEDYLEHAHDTNASKRRGPRTVAKGPKAGPLFFRRAVQDMRLTITAALKRALRRGLS